MAAKNHDDPIGGIPIAPAPKNQQEGSPVPEGTAPALRSGKEDKTRKTPTSGRSRRFVLAIVGIILALGLGAYLLIPKLLTGRLPQYLSKRLHRSVTIGDADFSLFPPALTLRHGIIGPRTDLPDDHVDPLLSFSELSLTLNPKALLRGKISIRKLTIIHPFFHLVLHRDGTSNFSVLLTRVSPQQQAPPIGHLFSSLLQFASAADITINNGQLLVDDEKTGRHHKLEKIVVRLPAGTVAAPGRNQHLFPADRLPEISAVINGNPVSLVGQEITTSAGPALDLRLQLNNTDLLPYAPYIPAGIGFRLLAGKGDLQLDCLLPRRGVSIGSIQLSATLKLSGLRLQDTASTEIAIGSLGLSARYLAANRQIIVKELKIDAPSFTVTRQADGTWSFPGKKLLVDFRQQKSADHPWRVEECSIRHGSVLFKDLTVKSGFTETFEDLALSLRGLHPADPQTPASLNLQARSRRKATVTMEGKLLFSPFSCSGMLLVDNLPLPSLSPYLKDILGSITLKKGELEKASAAFSISENENGKPPTTLNKTNLLVKDLSLGTGENSYLLPSLKITEASLDSASKKLEIGQLEVSDLKATVPENDLLTLANSLPSSADMKSGTDLGGWQFIIHQVYLQQGTLLAGSAPRSIRRFSFAKTEIVNLNSLSGSVGKVAGSLSFAPGGTLRFTGQLFLAPFRTELQIVLDDLPLHDFPEFWASWLNIPVQKGKLQAKGILLLPKLSFSGSVGINDFTAGDQTPSIVWRQLISNNCSLASQPFSLKMQTVILDHPYLRWTILEQNQSNLKNLIRKNRQDTSTAGHFLKFDDITIHEGDLDFADHALSPTYLTHLRRINGSIDSLSSASGSRSHMSLNGMLPGEASFSLDGNFGFFSPQFYADFTSNINDLDLRPLSPYTEPVLGYTLSSGLLNMKTSYHQENGIITADNNLKLTNLKLGRKLQNLSQLPLTIALLTDPDGTIELSVPVRGKTADPSFSFHNSFFATLRNLVLRTAVSPFSVLNALIPKRNALDLDHVSFDFGESEISTKAENQLAEIARAVKLRPWLAIAILGEADRKTDLETMKIRQKQQFAVQQLRQDRQLSSRLSRQYGNEEIDLGDLKDSASQQKKMEKALPGEAELVALAKERAQAVFQTLRKQGVAERQLHHVDRVLIVGTNLKSQDGNRVSLTLEPVLPL